jgi:hypothetical protein
MFPASVRGLQVYPTDRLGISFFPFKEKRIGNWSASRMPSPGSILIENKSTEARGRRILFKELIYIL